MFLVCCYEHLFSWHHRCVTLLCGISLFSFYRSEEKFGVNSASPLLCGKKPKNGNYQIHLALQKTKSVNCMI